MKTLILGKNYRFHNRKVTLKFVHGPVTYLSIQNKYIADLFVLDPFDAARFWNKFFGGFLTYFYEIVPGKWTGNHETQVIRIMKRKQAT